MWLDHCGGSTLVLLVLRRNKAENKETATEVGAATAVIPTMPRGKATSGGLTKPLNWNFMNRKAKKNWKKTRAKYKGNTQF